jgi:uncharacterized protein YpmS
VLTKEGNEIFTSKDAASEKPGSKVQAEKKHSSDGKVKQANKMLKVLGITVFALCFLFCGIIWGIRPPYSITFSDPFSNEEFAQYVEKQIVRAIITAPDLETFEISISAERINGLIAWSLLNNNIDWPEKVLLEGASAVVENDKLEIGAAFSAYRLPVALRAELEAVAGTEGIDLEIKSIRIGRVPLPRKLALSVLKRFSGVSRLSFSHEVFKQIEVLEVTPEQGRLVLSVAVDSQFMNNLIDKIP